MQTNFQPEIAHTFGIPIVLFDLSDCESLNHELQRIVLQRRASEDGIARSNIQGWHSSDDMLDWGGEGARQLADVFGSVCAEVTEFPQVSGAPEVRWGVRMWANLSEAGASNQIHCHPGAFWSGVYYVSDGGFSSDPAVGGQLIVHSPHETLASMYAPDVHIRLPNGQRLAHTRAIRPRTGRGVLFPSWLSHRVEPYHGTGVRISIAVNFSVVAQLI